MMSLKILFSQPPFVFLSDLNLLLCIISIFVSGIAIEWNENKKDNCSHWFSFRSRLFLLFIEKKNQRWAKHELEIMVEEVHDLDLDRNLDHVHVHDLSHQHHRKIFSFSLIFFSYFFHSVVVQHMHVNGMENQVIAYIFHHSIHEHLDVILKKSLRNLVLLMK